MLDGERGAYRAHAVVLVRHRRAEDGHDGVADVLVDGAAVALDLAREHAEVRAQNDAQLCRVEGGAQRFGRRQVGEEHGHDLALLGEDVRCRSAVTCSEALVVAVRVMFTRSRVA